MRKMLLLGGAVSAALALGLSSAQAFYQAQAAAPGGAGGDPQAIFNERCKDCHEPAVERAPSREEMRQRTPENLVDVLTKGAMAPMAAGLSEAQIRSLAVFLSGKPLGGAAAGAAGPAPAQPASQSPAPDAAKCAKDTPIKASASDWNGYNRDLASSRYQPNSRINAANVGRLKVKWSLSIAGGRYGQPALVGDHLFITTYAGEAMSLDARTGCLHWRVPMGAAARSAPIVEKRPGVSPSGWVVYVGDRNRDVYALDAASGKTLWKTNVESHPRALLTGAPALAGDFLYVPASSSEETIATVADYQCCTFSGSVTAIDVRTGKIAWKAQLTEPAKPTRKNSAGTQMFGPAGAAVWSQPTVDAKRKAIYVATGDSYTEVEAPLSDAVVAIDMASGKIKWATQVTKGDNFLTACGPQRRAVNCPLGDIGPDHDFGASPVLAKVGAKDVLVSGQKSGVAYGMDPDTGKLLWRNKLGAGSALGGVEWGMAFDGKRLFVPISDVIARQGANPGLSALDPLTGSILWRAPAPKAACSFKAPRCSNAQSAPASAAPGLVFAGGHDGWLRAYAADSGKVLWEHDTAGQTYATVNGVADQPGGSIDATGPVIGGDMVYVISGYTGATGAFGNPLNVLLAYSLDGK